MTQQTANEIERIRKEYASRAQRLAGSDLYSPFNPAQLFACQQRQRATLRELLKKNITDLTNASILEMGCGAGGVLTEFLNFGASPKNLHGVDLLEDRLALARQRLPASHFVNADGQRIPFRSQSFDIVLQYTAFSSVLDENIRCEIAKDMLRVLKPGGFIFWYDFWLNPANPQTRGIRPKEIRTLFPDCNVDLHKITLAPPIARRVVPVSWTLAVMLEALGLFNSHYFAVIYPTGSGLQR